MGLLLTKEEAELAHRYFLYLHLVTVQIVLQVFKCF